jgi:hypothetical protein
MCELREFDSEGGEFRRIGVGYCIIFALARSLSVVVVVVVVVVVSGG